VLDRIFGLQRVRIDRSFLVRLVVVVLASVTGPIEVAATATASSATVDSKAVFDFRFLIFLFPKSKKRVAERENR
jgi:hypothetical protein